MLLTIYDKSGVARAEVAVDDSSTQQKEIQGDNVLTLSFTYYEHIALDVNWYTDFEGERYWLQEKYAPKQKNESEWSYDLKLYGIESLIKRFLVLETTDGDEEPVFTLTATPREHVAMIVKCINDGMGHTTDWKVGQVDGTDYIVIDYEGKFCPEALKEIAEKVGGQAEWWIEGQTVNVCRCEHGEEITLGYRKGLTELERDTSNTEGFYTRLFPIGSTRNIDPERYGHSRLMLPDGRKCVELHTDEYGIYDRYEKDAFSGIFPRRTGTVSSVRSEAVTDEDGNAFTIYHFKDNSLNFDPNEYELAGETKRVSFQDGELKGLGTGDDHYFEVNYDSATGEFEIITIWPYDDDTQLPGGQLVPKAGDHYILWNIRMPDEYYPIAEAEFAEAVERYNEEHWRDLSVYKGPTDHVWVEENAADLYVGRRVRLESEKYFPETGYRNSRITKITRKVNLPSQMDLEISDALQQGVLERVNSQLANVKTYVRSQSGSLGLPDIIRCGDDTLPTDNNLFSARRSLQESLSKKKADRAKKKITFEEGIGIGLEDNAGIDGDGLAHLLSVIIRQFLRSPKFVDGLLGEGWQLWLDENGLANLTVDRLTVRQIMVILELLIERVRSVGGQLCVSAANGKIKAVEEQGDYYRITFEQDNSFVAHDLMRCATFKNGTEQRAYWVETATADTNGVTVEKSEFGGVVPEAGDECVLMGNTENALRQNLILISATEDGQPRIDVYNGVSRKGFTGSLRTRLGNLDGISDDWFPADNQPHGDGIYSDNAYLRGTFLLVTGEDIKTKFEITEGKIQSAVDGLRDDFTGEKGYLNNASFASGLEKWNTENETVFFLAGNRWIWVNNNVLTKKGDGASVVTDMGRTVVRIRNKYIVQKHENLRSIPAMGTDGEGNQTAIPVYLSFLYRCAEAGTLKVSFDGVDKTGFANFNSMEVVDELGVTEGYVQYTCDGLWNGTGDFRLEFDGEIYLYMLILSTDKVESLAYKYRTLFEQSDKLVRIAAANFDKDGNVLESSSIVTTSKYNALISERFNDDGTLKNTAGLVTSANLGDMLDGYVTVKSFAGLFAEAVSEDGSIVKKADISAFVTEDEVNSIVSNIHLGADKITLEGLVTANGNFKILEDGSIETINGKFLGEVVAISGKLGGTRQYNYETGEYEIVGGFEIAAGRIGSVATAQGSGGSLAIYDNFIRVGGSNGYVMFGNDVIPSSAGGAFTATGRIVNNHPNTFGDYGFDQANYGLFIDVSGGTKNYGISSNAALMAPAFINTKASILTFEGGSYSVDFSQHNIILMYYNQSGYSGTDVTLPTESSIASKFGLSTLPDDFATMVTFRVRTGSLPITLKGIYNHDENLADYKMAAGDSVTVLITKIDGFRYQIINHSS